MFFAVSELLQIKNNNNLGAMQIAASNLHTEVTRGIHKAGYEV